MQLLITGGAGFIGTNLIRFLLETTDWQLQVLDNLSAEVEPNLAWLKRQDQERIEIIEGDIRNGNVVSEAMEGCDYAVNLAAQVGVVDSQEDPYHDAEVNITGLLNVLEAAREQEVKGIVQASSAAPLGNQEPPLSEQDVPQPLAPYGASKLAGEGYCSVYASSFDLETVALRFSNVYGPHSLHKNSVIHLFVRQMLRGEQVTIYGDGEQTRDFVHARDIARAIYLVLTSELDSNFELLQIGTGRETSINQLYQLLKKEMSRQGLEAKQPRFKEQRPGEIERSYSDISRAGDIINYRPQITLEAGLKKLVAWYQEQLQADQ